MDFVALDFEIANANWASACQISLVRVVGGQIDAVWESLICPNLEYQDQGHIQYGIHKISQADYLNAATFAELWPAVQAFIGDLPVVAHNASFDLGVLAHTLDSWGISDSLPKYFCSQKLSEKLLPDLERHTLKALAEHFGIQMIRHHDAKSDALACAQLTLELMSEGQVTDVRDLMNIVAKRKTNAASSRKSTNLDISRIAAEAERASISEFLLDDRNFQYVLDAPFAELKLAVIRSVYAISDEKIREWILALGGEVLQPEQWRQADLVVLGNVARTNPESKKNDIHRFLEIQRSGIQTFSADDFYQAVKDSFLIE